MKKIITSILAMISVVAFSQPSKSIDSLKSLLKSNRSDTSTVNVLSILSDKLRSSGDFIGAKTYGEKGVLLSEKLGFKKGESVCYSKLGNANTCLGNYVDAYENFLKSLKIREVLNDVQGIANAYSSIGNVNLYQRSYKDALKNYFQSMYMQVKLNNKLGIAQCYHRIGIVYYSQGKFSEAIYNYSLALKSYDGLGRKSDVAYLYNAIAQLLAEQGKYSDAEEKYLLSLPLMKEIQDSRGVADCYVGIGTLYTKQSKFSQAKKMLNKSREMFIGIGDKRSIMNAYGQLSVTDSSISDFKSAYGNYKMYASYKDSLFNEENTKKTVQSQMQYDFGKKEDAVKAEQDKKDAVTLVEKNRQKVIIYSVSAGLFLVLLLAIFIFRGYRHKQRANLIISKQKQIVDERNKEITDSIHYASRIQLAILPPDSTVNEIFTEHCLYFSPKDIVSGDFYFIDKKGDKIFWAAADCTNHGVSGAMLSMLGANILSGVIKDGETVPSKILDKLNERINESLHKTDDDSIRDGMDIAICSLDKEAMILNYAGANNPLWIIRRGELIEYKADKMPIGQMYKTASYTNHEIQLESGDCIYSFSDGICDLHSATNKKFMKKRLRELLLSISVKPMSEQKKIIADTLNDFKGEANQIDDMLLIGIRV